mmetsp:Transcript_3240/g.11747  ORF Transcript_3240/g.11747 Transcript_3240/m.11747 type:complete len:224 (-) Transcript_3240:79-750(-)
MPQIPITTVYLGLAHRNRNIESLCVVNGVLTSLDLPLPPRSYAREGGVQREERQFEANLIVALASAPMSDSVRPHLLGAVYHSFCNDWARHRGTEQILPFVYSARPQAGEYVVGDEVLFEVRNEEGGSTAGDGFLLKAVSFTVSLTNVRSEAHDIAAVVLFQPRHSYGGIKAATVSQYNTVQLPTQAALAGSLALDRGPLETARLRYAGNGGCFFAKSPSRGH